MVGIIKLLLALLIAFLTVKLVVFLSRRITVWRRLRTLRKIEGVEVEFANRLALFLPRMTRIPLAKVRVHDTVYTIYLLNGGGVFRWVHFSSAEYAVFFGRMRGGRVARDVVTGNPTSMHTLSVGGHTEVLPKIEAGTNEKPVLLISPLPGNLTYVAENKTSIRVAFTGDEFYGRKVFAIKSFCRFIDRESRKEK